MLLQIYITRICAFINFLSCLVQLLLKIKVILAGVAQVSQPCQVEVEVQILRRSIIFQQINNVYSSNFGKLIIVYFSKLSSIVY